MCSTLGLRWIGKSIKAKCCLLLGFARFFSSGWQVATARPEFLGNEKTLRPAKWLTSEKKSRSTLTCNYAQATRLKIQVSILNICFIEKWSHVSMILFAPAWILETGSNNNNAEDNYTFFVVSIIGYMSDFDIIREVHGFDICLLPISK